MFNPWEITSGIFTLAFLLSSFYFYTVAGVRENGKRGWLLLTSITLLGPGFLFDLVGDAFENKQAELLSHGLVIAAGLLFLLSFYLSKKELEKETGGGVA